jgi:hypothetical protein
MTTRLTNHGKAFNEMIIKGIDGGKDLELV